MTPSTTVEPAAPIDPYWIGFDTTDPTLTEYQRIAVRDEISFALSSAGLEGLYNEEQFDHGWWAWDHQNGGFGFYDDAGNDPDRTSEIERYLDVLRRFADRITIYRRHLHGYVFAIPVEMKGQVPPETPAK